MQSIQNFYRIKTISNWILPTGCKFYIYILKTFYKEINIFNYDTHSSEKNKSIKPEILKTRTDNFLSWYLDSGDETA